MNIMVLEPARQELDNGRDYYLLHASPRIAESFLEHFNNAVRLLVDHPHLGKPLSARLRLIPIPHFPYSIIYRITSDTIIVQALAHQRRRPGYWKAREGWWIAAIQRAEST
jgi:plasmid stabilization system protein ParE